MDALRERTGSDLDVICRNGYGLIWTLSLLARMDALWEWLWSDLDVSWLAMDAVWEWIWSDLDVIMVGTWMLCGNGYGMIWKLSW